MGKFSTFLRATGLAITVAMPVAAQDADTVIATVDGTDITLGHMIALQERLPEQYRSLEDDVLYQGMLDQLVQQTALSKEMAKNKSKALALIQENEIRAFLASELLSRVGTAELEEGAVDALYKERYVTGVPEIEFNASHILVEAEDDAKAIITQIAEGADFAELAKEKSTGPSGPRGGELGWFGKGAMVPAFEEAVLGLEDGAVTQAPVQTQFGWHVVKRNDTRSAEAPDFETVRDELERELRAKAIEGQIDGLTAAAEVTFYDVEVDPALIRNLELLED